MGRGEWLQKRGGKREGIDAEEGKGEGRWWESGLLMKEEEGEELDLGREPSRRDRWMAR